MPVRILCLFLSLFLAACASDPKPKPDKAPPSPKLFLQPVSYSAIPGWALYANDRGVSSFRESCYRWEKYPASKPKKIADIAIAPESWDSACIYAELNSGPSARQFFETFFQPYKMTVGQPTDQALLTGYYEPMLHGSLNRQGPYQYPVWGVPDDLVKGQAYLSHREITERGLDGHAKALMYVDDPIELFFLQIQGSGRVTLDTGDVLKVGFAEKNGHGYVSIGKLLIDRGEISREEMSMQSLKAWLTAHPNEAQALLWENPSYVFFRLLEDGPGPIGAQGVPLTPEASLAVDDEFVPYGFPIFVDTTLPAIPGYPMEPFQSLVIAQDTGGAIKGPLRGDLFMGHGAAAEQTAGLMKQPASFYLFLPQPIQAAGSK